MEGLAGSSDGVIVGLGEQAALIAMINKILKNKVME
jgi:hypothetical protein